MKELKYSLKYILKSKEIYFALFSVLLVNLIHVFLVIHYNININVFFENGYRAEYLFILYNAFVSLNMIVIIIFPIISSTIYSDIGWNERKNKMRNILHFRVNNKKLIFVRFFIIILIVFLVNFIGFIMNYFALACIYGSGNAISYFQSPAFYQIGNNNMFLDSLRIMNPTLFSICISAHVSLLIALLAGLSYSISFFVKQKIIIYIFPFIFLIGLEFLLSTIGLSQYSLVIQLQPFSSFGIFEVLIVYFCLIILNILLLVIFSRQKDYL